jgi:hypothetical protein
MTGARTNQPAPYETHHVPWPDTLTPPGATLDVSWVASQHLKEPPR